MKTHVTKYIGRFWLEFGWFPGNPPCLFHIDVGMAIEGCPLSGPMITSVVIFGLQIAKFALTCGFDV